MSGSSKVPAGTGKAGQKRKKADREPSPEPFRSSIDRYTISVPQSKLDNLRKHLVLAESTFPQASFINSLGARPGEIGSWKAGPPVAEVQRLARVWLRSFDWRAREKELNSLPNYHRVIEVDGHGVVDVHFVWRQSIRDNAIPLLFVHGWPGSFMEMSKIRQSLAYPAGGQTPAFHIVAPSLPNFAFSSSPTEPSGFALPQYAETLHKLMLSLNYPQYVTQGGDWGHWITRSIGKLYPEACRASHYNMPVASGFDPRRPGNNCTGSGIDPRLLSNTYTGPNFDKGDIEALARRDEFAKTGKGYNILASTKPDTLKIILESSPIALLTLMLENLHAWSDDYKWSDEEILTWVSLYWFSTAGAGAAHQIYYEVTEAAKRSPDHRSNRDCTYEGLQAWLGGGLKIGVTHNPKEIEPVPRQWAWSLGEVVYQTRNDKGGHFYAFECPDQLVRDLRIMFGKKGGSNQNETFAQDKKGGAYGVIPGKDGLSESQRQFA